MRLYSRIPLAALGLATSIAILAIGASLIFGSWCDEISYFGRGTLPALATIPVTEADYPARGIQCIHALGLSHRRMAGTNIVVTYKRGTNPQFLTNDGDEYEMLSVELPDDLIGQRISLPSPDAQLRYSRGRLWSTHRCGGQIATEARGSLVTERIGNKLKVFLEVNVLLLLSGHRGVPESFELRREIIAAEQSSDAAPDVFDSMLQGFLYQENPALP